MIQNNYESLQISDEYVLGGMKKILDAWGDL